MEPHVGQLLDLMTSCNFAGMVNLDGRWGRGLEDNLDRYDRAYPERFYTFCHLDWSLLDKRHGPQRLVVSLERSVAAGARGLKIWKDLGLSVTVSYTDEPVPSCGRWSISGLGSPANVLSSLYRDNAVRLLGLARAPHRSD